MACCYYPVDAHEPWWHYEVDGSTLTGDEEMKHTTGNWSALTAEQRKVLQNFMLFRGGEWKRHLKSMWLTGTASKALMDLNETHGEKWLNDFDGNVIVG